MVSGIKTKNSATGSVQIDSDYKNLFLVSKGSSVTTSSFGQYFTQISYTGITPIMAITCSTSDVVISSMTISGSTYTWYITTTTGATVEWFIFDQGPLPILNVGYGIKVMDSAGNSTFNSNLKVLRVVKAINTADYRVELGNGNLNYYGSRKYATISSMYGYEEYPSFLYSGEFGDIYYIPTYILASKYTPGTGITFSNPMFTSREGYSTGVNAIYTRMSVLIVDVTDY